MREFLGRLLDRLQRDARDIWSFRWLELLQQDVRYALRGLRRSPGFTAAVVVTLGLGIGANAAMLGVIDRLMFQTPPLLKDATMVRRVYLQSTPGITRTNVITPYTRYIDFRSSTHSFAELAAYTRDVAVVGVGETAEEQPIIGASASFFSFFDARPERGRLFDASEDRAPAGARVAVLGYDYWQSHYGGRDVIGQTITIRDYECTIIGVAPRGFAGFADGLVPSIYIPITTYGANAGAWAANSYYRDYEWDWTQIIVRLKPGVSAAAANADLTSAFLRSRAAERAIHDVARVEKNDPHAIAGPLNAAAGPAPGLEARTLLWVGGVAAIVLLIACANVANLSLARALHRRREVALRLALGVSKGRLLAYSLTESIVLSLLGCAFGVVIAQWGGALLARVFIPAAGPLSVARDLKVVGIAIGVALVAGVATGLAPIMLARHDDLSKRLKSGARAGAMSRSTARSTLLIAQGALSVVLLVGAALFVRSLDHVSAMRLGYDADPVLQARWKRLGKEGNITSKAERDRVLRVAQALPGVEHAAWVSTVPFEGSTMQTLTVRGIASVERLGRFDSQTATPDYFATMQTRIVRGRAFTDADAANTPKVIVVGAGMAKVLWPHEDAIGKCISVAIWMPTPGPVPPCATVVGVAEDVVHDPIADEPYRYYLPLEQFPEFGASELVLRVRGNPASVAQSVQRALQAEMTGLSFVTVQPLSNLIDGQRRSWRIGASMFAAFGLLALIVAAVGLYGVISYDVTHRMHELGVRVALGAQLGNIVGLVVRQGVAFALAGVTVGTLLALTASRWLQPLLFHQSARDPAIYGLVAIVLLAVAVAASLAPALRAARADANVVLRSE